MTFRGSINQAISALAIDPRQAIPEYILNWLNAHVYLWKSIAASSRKDPNITRSDVMGFPVLLPPLAEQRKIAAILGRWDAAIATVEQLIAALRERKKGLMQQLLTGKVRFPEFVRSDEMKDTQFGKLPVEWSEGTIQLLSSVNRENADTDPEREWYYIDLAAIDQGAIDFPKEKTKYKDLPSRAQRVLHRDDVVMAAVRPNLLGYALTDFEPVDVLCSTGFAIISPHRSKDAAFIYHSLYSFTIQRQIGEMITGSNYPAINSAEVKKLRLPIPQLEAERDKLGEVLQTADKQIQTLSNYREKLIIQKRGFMQRLLTGQVRVQVDED